MTAYRASELPQAEDEVAALADLGRRVQRTKARVLLPMLLLAIGGGALAAVLHVSGYLPLIPLSDGSYFVNKGSIMIVTLLAGGIVIGPGLLIYKVAVRRTIAAWKRAALTHHRLDAESIESLAQMFAPVQSGRRSEGH